MPFISLFKRRTAEGGELKKDRSHIRVGIPKFLNVWSTHRFWIGFLKALGIPAKNIVFSSDTSEEQFREYGKGRIGMDSCYPVKVLAGHIGELLTTKKLDIILAPMVYSLPSFLRGHVVDTLSCTRVPMSVENIKAGFLKECNEFEKHGVKFVNPFVSFAEPHLLPKQLYESLKDALDVSYEEVERAVKKGLEELKRFDSEMRKKTREILEWCAQNNHPCILILARPYHMDPGIGHEIDVEFQSLGYPVVWGQYLPTDKDLMDWLFGAEIEAGIIKSPFDISDVWTSSYSSNTNEIIWGAKFAARFPWITAVVRLSSYECGMDQPTYTPVQKIVEYSGTLYFKFGDLDETRPSGSIRIRVETIDYYVKKYSPHIIERKLKRLEERKVPEGFGVIPPPRNASTST
ncbi:putative nucleotide-binding protein (sugar kinase/HSP70/actin superfamily) [Hydrogenivirga caldilitoris]|uniref:Putative nucleotide-binding protein (Sugar kinase/HSP70/actin superfamily) n=1 Tax=Hydrogenivirga caldilitoris TaxID=246264 RepID=A0A497XP20_9AQUI|nr:acyl-CoA dehydratase activase-related protein [Hydrogenivirga caldilitoris]RLJ70044.1 putative nucleotide-binding protein (sugar kinase/HSP70/actin superfamily) [Hydrogenivirga caldilitoris]